MGGRFNFRERFGEQLAAGIILVAAGLLIFAALHQQLIGPKVPPVNISSSGSPVVVAEPGTASSSMASSGSRDAGQPSQQLVVVASSSAQTGTVSGIGTTVPASVTPKTITPAPASRSSSPPTGGASGSSLSEATNKSAPCNSPLKPITNVVSGVETGLQSTLPLLKVAPTISGCS